MRGEGAKTLAGRGFGVGGGGSLLGWETPHPLKPGDDSCGPTPRCDLLPRAAPGVLWRVANNAPGGEPYCAPQMLSRGSDGFSWGFQHPHRPPSLGIS